MLKELTHRTLTDGAVLDAIPSKSEAHRLLICAALADKKTEIFCPQSSKDIDATIDCLSALGANIARVGDTLTVTPIDRNRVKENAVLDCGESGSTLRFLLTLACVLGADPTFVMHGRLAQRPTGALTDELARHGVTVKSEPDKNLLVCHGTPSGGEYTLPGDVSSQFVSSLIFALPLLGSESVIRLTGKTESEGYIDMTLESVRRFGINIEKKDSNTYIVHSGAYRSPEKIRVNGDWSNSAFWFCAAAIAKKKITVCGLDINSTQGDREILGVLNRMGAEISYEKEKDSENLYSVSLSASENSLCAISIDASQIPDLIPILSVVASVANGTTEIYNAARLRHKESDRISSVCRMLDSLGASVTEFDDRIVINGKKCLWSGRVDSYNDHRIAMSAAIAALACSDGDSKVIIDGAEAVNKSYPHFFEDYDSVTKTY